MLFDPKPEQYLGRLETRIRRAQVVTPELMSDVIREACVCPPACGAAAKLRIKRLIESDAWIDAVLALLELELPQWKLRRIVYEDGEWHCSLSRQPQLPLELDDATEASHEILTLAILLALLQAARDAALSATKVVAVVPRVAPAPGCAMCCDNFT